jgi:hypothetical protein
MKIHGTSLFYSIPRKNVSRYIIKSTQFWVDQVDATIVGLNISLMDLLSVWDCVASYHSSSMQHVMVLDFNIWVAPFSKVGVWIPYKLCTHFWVVLRLSQHLTICHDATCLFGCWCCPRSHWNKINLSQNTRINLAHCPNQVAWGKVKGSLRF